MKSRATRSRSCLTTLGKFGVLLPQSPAPMFKVTKSKPPRAAAGVAADEAAAEPYMVAGRGCAAVAGVVVLR